MKLLIVDDSMVVREMIERAAGRPEITEIHTAADGLRAMELFVAHRPELITVDLTMPGLGGLE